MRKLRFRSSWMRGLLWAEQKIRDGEAFVYSYGNEPALSLRAPRLLTIIYGEEWVHGVSDCLTHYANNEELSDRGHPTDK